MGGTSTGELSLGGLACGGLSLGGASTGILVWGASTGVIVWEELVWGSLVWGAAHGQVVRTLFYCTKSILKDGTMSEEPRLGFTMSKDRF